MRCTQKSDKAMSFVLFTSFLMRGPKKEIKMNKAYQFNNSKNCYKFNNVKLSIISFNNYIFNLSAICIIHTSSWQ